MHVPPPALDAVRLGVIGLGYVGAPLAVAFGRALPTVGFDIHSRRISELKDGHDRTNEIEPDELKRADKLSFSDSMDDLGDCNFFIVTVPTPIDDAKRPDLRPLEAASRTVGRAIKPGSVVVFESTVYPGATEEVCIPIIERESGLKYNQDFYAGYSPERINPGDREHRLETIKKVTSGSTPEVADLVDAVYGRIITAGTHKASSIRVAEAAKVIENTQRDLNIALVNELSLIFHRMGIDTSEVLAAAGTKWNFLPFKPGLVGGHCIGVDPYYLTHKAQQIGYHPEVILSGRRINDGMGSHVAERVVKLMTKAGINLVGGKVLVLGLAFKPDCPDLRNTRVVDVVAGLQGYGLDVDVHDPRVDAHDAEEEYGLKLVETPAAAGYDAIVFAVSHREFLDHGTEWLHAFGKPSHVIFDVSQRLPAGCADDRL